MFSTPRIISGTARLLLLLGFLFSALQSFSQKAKADSLSKMLKAEKIDTNRVRLMWQMGSAISFYNPDSALDIVQQALYLSRNINYPEGESRSLGVLSNAFIRIGNYPRALELNIEKLKLEEQRNNPRNLASVLMNIGVVYSMQEEFEKALEYYSKSDSVIKQHAIEKIDYNIALNKGDAYDRQNKSDSSFRYFFHSLTLARVRNEADLIGASMTGLGHSYRKLGKYEESLTNYQQAIRYLTEADDDEILSEACLGFARLFKENNKFDSAKHYANMALAIAKSGGFLSRELETAIFLTEHYKGINKIDSAFKYLSYVRNLNDSVNSKTKIRESQIISSNEKFRQNEIEEEKRLEKKKRHQQLQILLIAIFIPGFFLFTFLLSRINIPVRLIKLFGILSLLFLFEYLTLLLHPRVANFTHHTPIYEILIFVGIAAFIIPLHHRMEHWVIKKLTRHRIKNQETSTPPAPVENLPPVAVKQLPITTKKQVKKLSPAQPNTKKGKNRKTR
ncbi:MAG: tetratricopeptide repeat protein [Chitinophagaceae bacterium]|nr:tetratricopeptide repeat protein [Chitinophagaceae bacterium]MBK8951706.1 tetratricopeptide repeat protein [Chitinophagaceae bacterium]